jgi:hypothetical protein
MADMAGDPRRAVCVQVAVAEYRQATNQSRWLHACPNAVCRAEGQTVVPGLRRPAA